MAEIREATSLKPGEHFIWATNLSRKFVVADESVPHRLQVLKVVKVEDSHDGKLVRVRYLDSGQWTYFVTEGVLVAVVHDGFDQFHADIRCNNCGDRFGDHYCGAGITKEGINCKSRGSGEWFVPNEGDLRRFHHAEFDRLEDRFFSELGL